MTLTACLKFPGVLKLTASYGSWLWEIFGIMMYSWKNYALVLILGFIFVHGNSQPRKKKKKRIVDGKKSLRNL